MTEKKLGQLLVVIPTGTLLSVIILWILNIILFKSSPEILVQINTFLGVVGFFSFLATIICFPIGTYLAKKKPKTPDAQPSI